MKNPKTKALGIFLEEFVRGQRTLIAELEAQRDESPEPLVREMIDTLLKRIRREGVEMEARLRGTFHPN